MYNQDPIALAMNQQPQPGMGGGEAGVPATSSTPGMDIVAQAILMAQNPNLAKMAGIGMPTGSAKQPAVQQPGVFQVQPR